MSLGDDGEPHADRRPAARRAASGFAFLSEIFSLAPAAPRSEADARFTAAKLHRLVLGLTFAFVLFALAASSSFVVYTAWTHDLERGLFAIVFAVASSRVTINWLVWKNEEI